MKKTSNKQNGIHQIAVAKASTSLRPHCMDQAGSHKERNDFVPHGLGEAGVECGQQQDG